MFLELNALVRHEDDFKDGEGGITGIKGVIIPITCWYCFPTIWTV